MDLQLSIFRRSRVKLVRQTEVAECGLASLAMVANYHGSDIDLPTLRRRFQPSLRGASLKTLMGVADEMGLSPRAVKLQIEDLASLQLPAILHWNFNHFVVLEAVKAGKALIHNPDGTSRWYSPAAVSQHFTGVALELRPADDFEPVSARQTLRLSQLWRRMSGLKRGLAQTLVLTLVMQAFVLASPYYMQVAIDTALPALDRQLMTVLALGFGLFVLIEVTASLLRSFVFLSVGNSLSFGIATNIARRLFRLPISWFDRRHVGDVLSRFQSVGPIQQALTQGAVAALLDGVLAVLILTVMFFYSAALTALALTAFALYAAVRYVSFSLQREGQEAALVASAREQSTIIETIRGIVTLRLFNREAARHALWQNRLTDSVNATVHLGRIAIWQQTANTFIFGLEMIAVVWLAMGMVIDGGFSVGMVFAYLAYKTQFLTRSASLIDQIMAFRMLGLHLERLSDIAFSDQDVSFTSSPGHGGELNGRLELRNVGFRYSPGDPSVLEGVNLTVEAGDHIVITGPSGGGKSTMAKIILGLVEPGEGEVLVDGRPLAQFGYRNFRDQVAAVLQDDSLFAGSLADNIALFDETPDMDRIVEAAQMAAIHEDIQSMPMRYDTLVGDMGSALSGGQKQRVLLARALYRKPRLLVLDEGTSHLDVALEKQVNAAVSELGITRIVIAHRPETIMAARTAYLVHGKRLSPVLSSPDHSTIAAGESVPAAPVAAA